MEPGGTINQEELDAAIVAAIDLMKSQIPEHMPIIILVGHCEPQGSLQRVSVVSNLDPVNNQVSRLLAQASKMIEPQAVPDGTDGTSSV